jgi:hypothetical protein
MLSNVWEQTSSAAGARARGANRMADLPLLHGQLAKFEQFKREALTTAAARGDLSARRGGAVTFAYVDAWMTPTPERGAVQLDSALALMPLDASDDDAYYTVASTYALAAPAGSPACALTAAACAATLKRPRRR